MNTVMQAVEEVYKIGENTLAYLTPDPDATSPRDNDGHVGRMVCWHGRHRLGDEQPDLSPLEWQREHADEVMLPLYLYEHNGMTMNTSGFSCQWDSGQVGWISAPRQDDMSDSELRVQLEQEVDEYDTWLRGEVYGVVIETDGAIEDSLWGLLGYDYARDTLHERIEEYRGEK